MAFRFLPHSTIPDVKVIEPRKIHDSRGWFMESYVEREFTQNNLHFNFVQENHSCSDKGVFRGLHYQIWPYDQGKLIRVVRGRLIDYFMDLRMSSKTFGVLGTFELAPDSPMLWIPRGFAHGVHILEDGTELIYKVDNSYGPLHERGIDPRCVINLPDDIILSDKDKNWPNFINATYFL